MGFWNQRVEVNGHILVQKYLVMLANLKMRHAVGFIFHLFPYPFRSRENRCVMKCAQKYMDSTKEIGRCFADSQETKILGTTLPDISP